METVTLPLLRSDASIDDALKALEVSKRSGVIVNDGSRAWLIGADALRRSNPYGKLIEVDFQSRQPVALAAHESAKAVVDAYTKVTGPNPAGGALFSVPLDDDLAESLLQSYQSYEYAAVPVTRDAAVVVGGNLNAVAQLGQPPPTTAA